MNPGTSVLAFPDKTPKLTTSFIPFLIVTVSWFFFLYLLLLGCKSYISASLHSDFISSLLTVSLPGQTHAKSESSFWIEGSMSFKDSIIIFPETQLIQSMYFKWYSTITSPKRTNPSTSSLYTKPSFQTATLEAAACLQVAVLAVVNKELEGAVWSKQARTQHKLRQTKTELLQSPTEFAFRIGQLKRFQRGTISTPLLLKIKLLKGTWPSNISDKETWGSSSSTTQD